MASTIDQESTSVRQPGTDLVDLAATALLTIGSRIRQFAANGVSPCKRWQR